MLMRNKKLKTIDQHLAEKAEKARVAEKNSESERQEKTGSECQGSEKDQAREKQETGEPAAGKE
jgi:hypothetical protein